MVEFTVLKGSHDGTIISATTLRSIKPDEVLIQVTHSGICYTDQLCLHTDMALGHEGVGVVQETGKDVTRFKKGDRVGWGYQHSCCGHCKQCLRGTETFCAERELYGLSNLDQGSFATAAIWKQDFIFSIPPNMESRHAAPLMCGGATVFNALHKFGTRSTDRVGVMGIGGLGHIAIQFASKMGCQVVVFSSTEWKRDEAMALGAKEFYATKGVGKLEIGAPLDHLIVTTSIQPDWDLYLPVMAPQGTIYPLTVSEDKIALPTMVMLMNGLRLQGTVIAAWGIHREMLEFAAFHDIKPIVEEFPLSVAGATEAMERLGKGKMRYRGVLVAESQSLDR